MPHLRPISSVPALFLLATLAGLGCSTDPDLPRTRPDDDSVLGDDHEVDAGEPHGGDASAPVALADGGARPRDAGTTSRDADTLQHDAAAAPSADASHGTDAGPIQTAPGADGGPDASSGPAANDDDRPTGFAGQPGQGLQTTTGGGNAAPIEVTTCAELKSALADTKAQVVALPVRGAVDCRTAARPQAACVVACKSDPSNPTYRVAVPNQSCAELDSTMSVMRTRNETQLNVRSNKTLLGRGATLRGASLNMSGSANVIVRDLVIEDVNPGLVEAGDGITLQNSHHIWIDHCRFKLVSDGHVDMTSSSNVTLSWNHFDGRNPAVCGGQHHYVHLVADSTVTFHHNFYDHTSGRNPKLDGAKTRGHLFNNHYLAISYFSIGASGSAEAKVENNFFDDARKPHWRDGGKVAASNNRYTGVSAAASEAKDTGDSVFGDVTMYPYTADPADGVPSNVDGHAGPR